MNFVWNTLWEYVPGQFIVEKAGGHVLAGEFGFEATIRECKEEIGIELQKNDLIFIGSTKSTNIKGEITNNHFNEFLYSE